MVSTALASSTSRPIALRMRPDLRVEEVSYQGEQNFVVKDPISLQYSRLRREEMFVLRQLDGKTSLGSIKKRFDREFSPRNVTVSNLQRLLEMLYSNGLVLAESAGQSRHLEKRDRDQSRQQLIANLSSVLFIRFPGFDPERLLRYLYPLVAWLFRPFWMLACCGLMLSAGALLISHFDDFQARLPEFEQFFSVQSLLLFAVVISVTKVLHELGHALACKHFGGECHQIGLMLLVFTPALYCDTSDSWLLRSKWKRAAVGAAGMFVELVFASICTFIWWNTQPGILHYLCLRVMFIASVSTVLFNGNPLLRYDGYFILSDLLEIPNLGQESQSLLQRFLRTSMLGIEDRTPLPERNKVTLFVYAIASFLYRWFVLIVIMVFINRMLKPYDLQALGYGIVILSIVGMFSMPAHRLYKYLSFPGRFREMKRVNVIASLCVITVLAAAIMLVPVSHFVTTSAVVRPIDPQHVYVSVSGFADNVKVRPGDTVAANDVLAELKNPDLEIEILELQQSRDTQKTLVDTLSRLQNDNPDAASRIPTAIAALQDIEKRLEKKLRKQKRLNVVAPRAGTVLPAEGELVTQGNAADMIKKSGLPTDRENQGGYLETGTVFCKIGEPSKLEALVVIDQSDLKFVHTNQEVQLSLDAFPLQTFKGQVREISKLDIQTTPRELAAESRGEVATEMTPDGGAKPLFTSYEARIQLEETDVRPLFGFRGRARILVDRRSIGEQLRRFVASSLRFR